MDVNLGKLQEMVGDREAWHAAVHGVMKSQTRLGDWSKTPCLQSLCFVILSDVLCFWGPEWVGSSLPFESGTHFFFFPHRASNEPLPFLVWTFHTLTHSPALFVLWHNYFFVVCIWRYFLQMQSLFYSPIWPVSWLWDMPFHP